MVSISDWTPQQRDVGQMIVDMYASEDPSGNMEFTPQILCFHCGKRFSYLWPKCGTVSYSVTKIMGTLRDYGALIQPQGRFYPYRLNKKGCLYLILSLRIRHDNADVQILRKDT